MASVPREWAFGRASIEVVRGEGRVRKIDHPPPLPRHASSHTIFFKAQGQQSKGQRETGKWQKSVQNRNKRGKCTVSPRPSMLHPHWSGGQPESGALEWSALSPLSPSLPFPFPSLAALALVLSSFPSSLLRASPAAGPPVKGPPAVLMALAARHGVGRAAHGVSALGCGGLRILREWINRRWSSKNWLYGPVSPARRQCLLFYHHREHRGGGGHISDTTRGPAEHKAAHGAPESVVKERGGGVSGGFASAYESNKSGFVFMPPRGPKVS